MHQTTRKQSAKRDLYAPTRQGHQGSGKRLGMRPRGDVGGAVGATGSASNKPKRRGGHQYRVMVGSTRSGSNA